MPHIPPFADTVNVCSKHHLLAVLQNPCATVVGLDFNSSFFFSLKPGSPPVPGEKVHMVKEERVMTEELCYYCSLPPGAQPLSRASQLSREPRGGF